MLPRDFFCSRIALIASAESLWKGVETTTEAKKSNKCVYVFILYV